jgi:hypothetical protein
MQQQVGGRTALAALAAGCTTAADGGCDEMRAIWIEMKRITFRKIQ